MLTYIKHSFLVGLVYIGLSLIIGENHPFTQASMYDTFPPIVCTFYLTDTNQNLLPLTQYYNYTTSNLTHYYNAVTAKQKLNEPLTPKQLQLVGRVMVEEIKRHNRTASPVNIQLHRIDYFLNNGTIQNCNTLMYESGR